MLIVQLQAFYPLTTVDSELIQYIESEGSVNKGYFLMSFVMAFLFTRKALKIVHLKKTGSAVSVEITEITTKERINE